MTATNQVSFSLWDEEESALLAPTEEPKAPLECVLQPMAKTGTDST